VIKYSFNHFVCFHFTFLFLTENRQNHDYDQNHKIWQGALAILVVLSSWVDGNWCPSDDGRSCKNRSCGVYILSVGLL